MFYKIKIKNKLSVVFVLTNHTNLLMLRSLALAQMKKITIRHTVDRLTQNTDDIKCTKSAGHLLLHWTYHQLQNKAPSGLVNESP